MSDPNHSRPERPRSEPEIIPPGRHSRNDDFSSIFIRIDETDGVRRVHLRRPGPFAIAFGLIAFGLIVAVIVLLLAGLVLIWIPIVIGAILVGLFSGSVRRAWQQLRSRWN